VSGTATAERNEAENGSAAFAPPRVNLFRALDNVLEVRDPGSDGMPVLFGHFTRFNEWTEIDSFWEGRFMERIAPGAFKKTFSEQRKLLRCLFQHGRDPYIGNKPLGPIRQLEEQREGPYYEVDMLDVDYCRSLVPGLREDLYGASFRMAVMREEIVKEPGRSKHNPEGIPERTIKEVRLFEFGPVTFPAYANATAGVRSITDWYLDGGLTEFAHGDPDRFRSFLFEQLQSDPVRLRSLLDAGGNPISRAADEVRETVEAEEAAAAEREDAPEAEADTTNQNGERDAGRGDAPSTSPSTPRTNRNGRQPLRGRSNPPWKLGH
jgi:HK97 family phage prohead protease